MVHAWIDSCYTGIMTLDYGHSLVIHKQRIQRLWPDMARTVQLRLP